MYCTRGWQGTATQRMYTHGSTNPLTNCYHVYACVHILTCICVFMRVHNISITLTVHTTTCVIIRVYMLLRIPDYVCMYVCACIILVGRQHTYTCIRVYVCMYTPAHCVPEHNITTWYSACVGVSYNGVCMHTCARTLSYESTVTYVAGMHIRWCSLTFWLLCVCVCVCVRVVLPRVDDRVCVRVYVNLCVVAMCACISHTIFPLNRL